MHTNHSLTKSPQVSWRRTISIGLVASLLVSLSIKPCRAQLQLLNFLGNGLFGNIISQLTTIFPQISSLTQWASLLQNSINDPCTAAPILLSTPSVPGWCTSAQGILQGNASISTILKGVTGVMGLPDPTLARSTIGQQVMSAGYSPDVFITSPTLFSQELGNLTDRVGTFLNAQTFLTSAGQQQIQNQINISNQSAQTIASTSDAAQGYSDSQDVLKAIARILAQQSIVSSMSQASTIASRTDTQFTNLNLANISDSMDQQNRQRQAANTVDSYALLNLTAQSNLF